MFGKKFTEPDLTFDSKKTVIDVTELIIYNQHYNWKPTKIDKNILKDLKLLKIYKLGYQESLLLIIFHKSFEMSKGIIWR
jgi:hypothetical protein